MPDDLQTWLHIIYQYTHDLSIAVYIGGAVAMEFVIGPAQASIPPAQAQVMGQKTGARFNLIAWGALITILVTGILRLQHMDMITWTWPFFESPLVLSESYGRTLLVMFLLWCWIAVNGLFIARVFRPRLEGRIRPGTSAAQAASSQDAKMAAATWMQRLTRTDLVLATLIALLGVSLKWGGMF